MLPIEKPASILVVDDIPENLRLLSQILRDRGYHLRAVTNGERALASVELDPPELILLDVRMPEMDGYEVCQRLKANLRTQDIPILFISALDEIEDKVRAFSVGGVDYITKPFHAEEVLARVQTHLSLRRLQQRLQEANRRMESEMALAAQVQASFLARTLPELPGWQLSVSLIPAKMTSGDFFDVVRLPDGRVGILIADVVDKGVGAALFMAMSCGLLRTYLMEHPDRPDQVFQCVNQRILEYTSADQFVTVFLGVLDSKSGHMTYSNAGHNPPLWSNWHTETIRLLSNTGPPLGILENAVWQCNSIQLSSGHTLILYTDGITDAENGSGEFFGLDRLMGTLRRHPKGQADSIKEAILDATRQFTGGAPLSDDIALVIVARDEQVVCSTENGART